VPVFVLWSAYWLLYRVHAALRAGPHGHDPPHAALRRYELATVVGGRGDWRRRHPGGDRQPGHPARRLDPRPRETEGHRGPMERPNAGMGDRFAAATLEFRRAPASYGHRRILEGEAGPARATDPGIEREKNPIH